MARAEARHVAFNAGEISPRMYGRRDMPAYGRAAEEIRNLIVLPQGGLVRAPGTRYAGAMAAHDKRGRFEEFIFSDSQAYVLIFGDRNLRFGMNEGLVLGPDGAPYEIATPWPSEDLGGLEFAQSNDVIYIVHEARTYQPQTLTRSAHADWSLDPYVPQNGPWLPTNTTAVSISANAVTGSVELEATAPTFEDGHVGALWRLEQNTRAELHAWEPAQSFPAGAEAFFGDNVYQLITRGSSGETGAVAPAHLEGDAWDGEKNEAFEWRYLHSGYGIVKITSVTDSTHAIATVEKRLPTDVKEHGTTYWREGAWSTKRGWPSTTTFFEQRLAMAASLAEPQTGWLTVAGNFRDYDIGRVEADDAITFTIASRTANPIRSIAEGPGLIVLTSDREYLVFSSQGGPLAPDNPPAARPMSTEGASAVTPLGVGGGLLFVGKSHAKLFELVFAGDSDRFTTVDRTRFADHILRPARVADVLWNWQAPAPATVGETDETASVSGSRAGDLERLLRAVTLIPASGEFAYGTTPVTDIGLTLNEHAGASGKTDAVASIDQLLSLAPNIESVSVVAAWHGTDLRCGACEIQPRVETKFRGPESPYVWFVSGMDRDAATLVSQVDDVAVLGGAISDRAVYELLVELASRGIKTTFYPFILMDVAAGNTLPNPYSDNAAGVGQAVYPWRGRVTCSPAAGFAGTVDKTAAAATQVDLFFGSAEPSDFVWDAANLRVHLPAGGLGVDFRYRRFILSMATLCAAANAAAPGSVEAFVIGSEMIGLTTIRSDASTYPAVAHLTELAADCRSILGGAVQIGYAADWSEYHSHRPSDGSGDVYFHLDPLWSDDNIDFIGIDNYLPYADWRDGTSHLDYEPDRTIYDRDYLQSNVEGGEYYDWYYASSADRDAQTRTTITDGAHGKAWVFRNKDIRNWWLNEHFDRPGGGESATPTAWTPQSKPIWFTEFGCPAVDKGPNQPNVFFDPKSSESFVPYYSSGVRDDDAQRAYNEAVLDYWDPAGSNNPLSTVYADSMIRWERAACWTWDARPYPAFPNLETVWGDVANWSLGHWLTGRIGGIAGAISFTYAPAGVTEMAWAREPYGVVWIVRGDGLLIGYTHRPQESVHAFHRRAFKGAAVESLAVIPDPQSGEDQVWLLMVRSVGGQTRRYIEIMAREHRPTDKADSAGFWHLDSALDYDGPPATSLSGFDHLEGETVSIWADGAAHADKTVAGGVVSLDRAVRKAIVGINSPAYLRLPPVARGRKRQAKTATLLVRDTIQFDVAVDGGPAQASPVDNGGDLLGSGPHLFSGEVEVPLTAAPGLAQRLEILINHGGPFTLESAETDLRMSER